MRAIVLLLAGALCCGSVRAAVPHQINYQGFLTNPGGSPVNTTVDMVFTLYDGAAVGANQLYTETQLNVPVVNGVFNVLIGHQQAQFSLLAFDVPYWLAVKVASDAEMTPRQAVAAAAYAIRSATTEALAPTATVPASQISGAIGSATSFTGNLAGDVTGQQAATIVALVGGVTAANVAAGASLANAATSGNTFGALVRRDASGNYSANTISTIGGLNLATTNGAGTQGVINQAGNRLLHSVGNANFFAGTGAGNFGMTGGNNAGVGNAALAASTSGGQNTAGGSLALSANTSGGQNTASGYAAMQGNLTGGNNAAFGASALQTMTGGNFNTAVGGAALSSVAGSSSNNIGIGFGAGGNLTTGSGNIDIGNAGVAGESNIIRIGTSQTDTYLTGVIHGNGSALTLADASITSAKLAASGCTTGQILKYSGSAWACAADDTGVPAGGAVGQVLVGTGSAPAWSNSPVISGNVSVGSASAAAARLDVSGSGWFRADANGFSASAAQGVRVFYDTFSSMGNVYAYDYAAVSPLNLKLQSPGGNVAIGNTVPGSKLTVAGTIESTIGGVKFPDGTTQTTAATSGGATATNYAFAIDTTQQYIVTPNVFQDIMFNNNVQMNGWTHVSGTSTFSCPKAGLYLIQYTASGSVSAFTGASQYVRTLLNGSEIVGSQSLLLVQTGIQTTVLFGLGNTISTVQVLTLAPLSKSFIVSMNAADVVSFQQMGSDTNVLLTPAGNGGSISMTIIKIQ